jgi:hypothetical protein
MERIILTDVDGVLLDWFSSFDSYMTSKGLPTIPGNETSYMLAHRHGIPDLEAYKMAREFNSSSLIEDLKPITDAQKYVGKLHAQGFRFVAITSLSDHPRAYSYRKQNLKRLFGTAIQTLICLDTGASKIDTLKQWEGSGLFWIEDHIRNALDGAQLGLKSILVSAPYNGMPQETLQKIHAKVGFERPWEEIYSLIGEHYELLD